jgi:3-isopropylmalate dehydrogenase
MLLRHSFGLGAEADAIDAAIGDSLAAGDRTADLIGTAPVIGCREMGRRVAERVAG